MKKILKYIVLFLAVAAIVYVIATGKLSTFTDLVISANDKFVYSSEFKVNSLQSSNADFYYNLLSENQKKIYSAVARGVSKLDKNILVGKYEIGEVEQASKDAKEAINAFLGDHPEVFYMNSEYTISITESVLGKTLKIEIDYTVKNIDELNSQIDSINLALNGILSQVSNMTDFEKELYVHDYLAKNIKYFSDFEDENNIPDKYHTIYSAILEKEAVCDGISKAYQLILNMMGIENHLVTGVIGSTPHAWNMVKIEDSWLHVDVTSDKYIKDSSENTIEPVHTYFNVNTDFISNTHSIDKKEILPESTSSDYTYYKKMGAYISSSENFETRVKEIVNKQKDRKILEIATDFSINVPERLLKQLYNLNFNNLKSKGNNVAMEYYSEQNVYIVKKD